MTTYSGDLSVYLGSGNIADRPATPSIPPTMTALWFSDDTGELSAYTVASGWTTITGGGGGGNFVPSVPITKPVASQYTFQNGGTSTKADGQTGVVIAWEGIADANYRNAMQSFTGDIYTVRLVYWIGSVQYPGPGIMLRESGTGKAFGFRFLRNGSAAVIAREAFTAPATRTSVGDIDLTYTMPPNWWRFDLSDGTNVKCQVSNSGETGDWTQLYSAAITSLFTTAPNECGIYTSSSQSNPSSCVVQSDKQV